MRLCYTWKNKIKKNLFHEFFFIELCRVYLLQQSGLALPTLPHREEQEAENKGKDAEDAQHRSPIHRRSSFRNRILPHLFLHDVYQRAIQFRI